MGPQTRRTIIALGLGLAAVGACKSDSSTGTGGSTNLSGNYSLLAFQQDTNPPFGPPYATGTLALTATNYHLSLNVDIPSPGDTTVLVDSGTYTTHGDSIAEHSLSGLPDAIGTFVVKADTLQVNVVESALKISTTWHKN